MFVNNPIVVERENKCVLDLRKECVWMRLCNGCGGGPQECGECGCTRYLLRTNVELEEFGNAMFVYQKSDAYCILICLNN